MLMYSMSAQATMMLSNYNKSNEFKSLFTDITQKLDIEESQLLEWTKRIDNI